MKEIENIEDYYYGSALTKMLYKQKNDYPDSTTIINLFIELCSTNIKNFISNSLQEEILDNFSTISDIKNKEISARWREYLSIRFAKDKKEHLPKAVFLYLEIFIYNNDPDYLLNALKLVKSAKALFNSEKENIYEIAKKTILEMNFSQPFLVKEIMVELFSLNPARVQEDFGELLNQWIEKLQSNNDYNGAHHLILLLFDIKLISAIQSKIKLAENHEKNGDFESRNKKANTYYPTILSYYQNGSRELKSISGQDELKNRLHAKIISEQMQHAKMHLAVAKNYNNENSEIEKFSNEQSEYWLSLFETFDFQSGLQNLLSFPISLVNGFNTSPSENNSLSPFFDTVMKQDANGKIVGKTTLEMYSQIQDKRLLREAVISFIRKTKWRMDREEKIDKGYVQLLLKKMNTHFIPEDRIVIFVNGISAGFNNDFVTAAHLLVPQLENSFKHVLQIKNKITFKIDEEVQHDNTLGGILEILINNYQHSVFDELKDFLIENSNVNFRNELCHGILPPFIIEHYGIYVWWLTLKMIRDCEEIFILHS